MDSFKTFVAEQVLSEHILSIGLNDSHEVHREKHRHEIHQMIHRAYAHPDIGGYGGAKSGSKEESDAIHHDITHSVIKATKRDGKITAVNLYKKQHGRKSIASATDNSEQGKKDWMKTKLDDHEQKRAWGEVSGKAEHLQKKMGVPVIPANHVGKLLGKEVKVHDDGEHYTRKIGGEDHTKVAMGHPKINESTKVVDDGTVLNVHHNGKHIGNIMKSSSDKKTPFRAYSKHWDMKRLHPTKKSAIDWLVQTHNTANSG